MHFIMLATHDTFQRIFNIVATLLIITENIYFCCEEAHTLTVMIFNMLYEALVRSFEFG